MALTATNALVNIQDASGAAVAVANGGIAQLTPGTIATFSLQSTAGVNRWTLQLIAPSYPSLHLRTVDWYAGQANLIQVPLPGEPISSQDVQRGVQFVSTVTDGVQAIAFATGFIQTVGGAGPIFTHVANLVAGVALAAYTNVNGTITANANGVMANVDGVTPTVGMNILLVVGIAAAAVDAGLYQVTSVGSASTPFVLTRASDMAQGSVLAASTEVRVIQGNAYGGTQWVQITTGNIVVGTATTQGWFPRSIVTSVALVSGTSTITLAPIISAGRVQINVSRVTTGGTVAAGNLSPQVGAGTTGVTAGNLGTASLVITAMNATATAAVATDTSTVLVQIVNQC
jgi:hypothetical protein